MDQDSFSLIKNVYLYGMCLLYLFAMPFTHMEKENYISRKSSICVRTYDPAIGQRVLHF